MSLILSTTNQSRWPDCFAPSAKVGLTVRSNGEERVLVYTDQRELVQAGFDPPAVAPAITDSGAGSLGAGFVVYRYCYASSIYPNVEAVETSGGEVWPKSNPSPVSAVYTVAANKANNVRVTKTTRSDVDEILIYRTSILPTSAEAVTAGDAGNLNFVGSLGNDGIAGTAVFNDNVTAPQEQLEIDNFVASQFWKCVYEDPFWWGVGNPDLNVAVTLNGTIAITAASNVFFSGRQNQFVVFDGINSGGFDGQGTYYFRYLSANVANVSAAVDGAAAVIGATGTTTMRVRGYAGTLYRSKARNPFAWGFTEYQAGDGGSIIRVPQQFAFPLGGHACAIAVLPDARLLKIDVENPSTCYTLNLNLAGSDGFEASKRTIDKQYVCSSHHAQFVTRFPSGETMLTGIDSANTSIIKASPSNQSPMGDEVFQTMFSMVRTGDNPRLYHGLYDPNVELSVWWIKTATDVGNLMSIDTALCFHGPSGQWSIVRDLDVTASASVFDPVTLSTITLIGTATGQIAQAFVDGAHNFAYASFTGKLSVASVQASGGFGSPVASITVTPTGEVGVVPNGAWMLFTGPNGDLEMWGRKASLVSAGVIAFDLWYDPAAGTASAALASDTANSAYVTNGVGGSGPAGFCFPGVISCEARTYFQTSQSGGSQLRELWSSFRNAGSSSTDALFYRFYPEFDTNPLGAPVAPVRVTRPEDGLPSVNWVARNIPAALTPQMGLRLVERGYGAFEVLGLNLKLDRT